MSAVIWYKKIPFIILICPIEYSTFVIPHWGTKKDNMEIQTKLVYKSRETVIDENGEIKLETETKGFPVEREPDYVKLYLHDLVRLNGLPKSSENLMLALAQMMTKGNIVALYMPIKKRLAVMLNTSVSNIDKGIKMLVKAKMLIRQDRGLYIIDPYLVGRGKWDDVKKLRISLEYSPEYGRRVVEAGLPRQPELPFDQTDALPGQGWED